MNKRVLFVPCGVGLGHATRIHAIMKEVEKSSQTKVATYERAYEYFQKERYAPTKMMGFNYDTSDSTFTLFENIVKNMDYPFALLRDTFTISSMLSEFKPDVVVSDSEPNAFFASTLFDTKKVMVMNLLSVLEERKYLPRSIIENTRNQIYVIEKLVNYALKRMDMVIFPSLIKYKNISSKVKIVDLIVRQKPNELPNESVLRDKLNQHSDFYLVNLGGSAFGKEFFTKIVKVLKKFEDKKFIISSNYSVLKPVEKDYILIVPFLDNFLEYLKICKGAISLAGHSSISEFMVYKKPSLIIPITNHIEQISNANMLRRYGLAETLFEIEDEERLRNKLKKFFDSEEEIKKKIESLNIKGKGAEEAAEFILNV
ncbi:MAG: glycosyltransferase family protein [Candidatus Nanoarchaeia archaeon]|nr:glycosyltransferase family protein [Candidatus Nanoarchaeia archaeon]